MLSKILAALKVALVIVKLVKPDVLPQKGPKVDRL